MNARDELAPLQELDAHKPTFREYEGGWWELACTGCDFAKGRRLSHLDWAPHHEHRAEVFREALAAAGYRKPRTITTAEELDALGNGALIRTRYGEYREAAKLAGGENVWRAMGPAKVLSSADLAIWSLPASVLHEPEAAK